MQIKIIAFGISKDIIGKQNLTLTIDETTTVTKLKQILISKYPRLKDIKSFMIAINHQYAIDSKKIKKNDEIAIIPPTNGG